MRKIKLIGPRYLTAPLALLGIEVHPADSEPEATRALSAAAAGKEPALIFITESLAVDLRAEISRINRRPEVNVVLIPDNRGSTGLAEKQIGELVKYSIGAEVIIRK